MLLFDHPAQENIIIVREWQLVFCKNNQCAAALLSFLEFAVACKIEVSGQNSALNRKLKQNNNLRTLAEDILVWYTEEQLEKRVIFYKRKTIRKSLKLLVDLGAISICKNPDPRYNKRDKTKHFSLNIELIKLFLENYKNGKILETKELLNLIPSGKNASSSGKITSSSGKNAVAFPKTTSKTTSKSKIPPTPLKGEAEKDGGGAAASSLRSKGARKETVATKTVKRKREENPEVNRIRGELIKWTRDNTGVAPAGRELQAVSQLAQMGVVPEIAIACYLDIASSSLAVKGWGQVVVGYSAFVLAYNGNIKRRVAGQIKSRTEQTIENANIAFAVMEDRQAQGLLANPLDEVLGAKKLLTEGDNEDEYNYDTINEPLP